MRYSSTEEKLLEFMAEIEVIDAHEHLPPERVRVSFKVDVMTLFSHYTRTDFISAGMSPQDYERMINPEEPLEERWKIFKPFFKFIRYGSYARPALIAVKEFYGFDDITDDNYMAISERMMAENTQGIYKRILWDKCHIRAVLTQAGRTDYDLDYLIPLMPMDTYASVRSAEEVEKRAENLKVQVKDLDDYLQLARKGIERWKSEGAVGLKTRAQPNDPPDRKAAEEAFKKILNGGKGANLKALYDYLVNEIMEICADLDMVVAVHAGMWGDFRVLDPKHMIPVFPRHPRTRFDLYHMGMPWVRDTGVIGKNNQNVWLNLCWCHIISPEMTCSALDEWIDLVPVNKIIAFGGDYSRPVEKVYGHLLMAKEDIARVLARRIDRGLMGFDEATFIIKRWFWDNPKELYKLDLPD